MVIVENKGLRKFLTSKLNFGILNSVGDRIPMAKMDVPKGYTLSEEFVYDKRGVRVFTNGESQIFDYIWNDAVLGWFTMTRSEPTKIANGPEIGLNI
jgi:hypothetical protein